MFHYLGLQKSLEKKEVQVSENGYTSKTLRNSKDKKFSIRARGRKRRLRKKAKPSLEAGQ